MKQKLKDRLEPLILGKQVRVRDLPKLIYKKYEMPKNVPSYDSAKVKRSTRIIRSQYKEELVILFKKYILDILSDWECEGRLTWNDDLSKIKLARP